MWMDPQQRKLLEVVYEAFESGGVTLKDVSGSSTACFVPSFTADFQQMAFKEPAFRHSSAATGVDPGIISNRISHVFNLNGPSIVVSTPVLLQSMPRTIPAMRLGIRSVRRLLLAVSTWFLLSTNT